MLDAPDRPAWAQSFLHRHARAGRRDRSAFCRSTYNSPCSSRPNTRLPVALDIAYVTFIAFLMASRIPHFSGKKIGRIPPEYFMVILFGVAAILLLLGDISHGNDDRPVGLLSFDDAVRDPAISSLRADRRRPSRRRGPLRLNPNNRRRRRCALFTSAYISTRVQREICAAPFPASCACSLDCPSHRQNESRPVDRSACQGS